MLAFYSSSRQHGSKNKCIYGCENLQYAKTGHYLRHVQNKHPEKVEECLALLPSFDSTLENNIFCCDNCEFKTLTKSSMKFHVNSHLPLAERNKFKCHMCHKNYTRASTLRLHILTVHDKLSKIPKREKVKCTLCERTFLERSSLLLHQREVHNSAKMPSKSIDSVKTLNNLKERLFRCFCGASYSSKKRFVKHQINHDQEILKRRFKCPGPHCHHAFKQRCNLMRHQKEKKHFSPEQLNKLKFKCHCGAQFFTERGIGSHRQKCTS